MSDVNNTKPDNNNYVVKFGLIPEWKSDILNQLVNTLKGSLNIMNSSKLSIEDTPISVIKSKTSSLSGDLADSPLHFGNFPFRAENVETLKTTKPIPELKTNSVNEIKGENMDQDNTTGSENNSISADPNVLKEETVDLGDAIYKSVPTGDGNFNTSVTYKPKFLNPEEVGYPMKTELKEHQSDPTSEGQKYDPVADRTLVVKINPPTTDVIQYPPMPTIDSSIATELSPQLDNIPTDVTPEEGTNVVPISPLISEYMADILKADSNTVEALRNGIVRVAKNAYGVLVEQDLLDKMKNGILNTDEVTTNKSDIQQGYSWNVNMTINKDTGDISVTPAVTVEPEPLSAITIDLNHDDVVFTKTPHSLTHLEDSNTIGRGQLHPEVYYTPPASEDSNTIDGQNTVSPLYPELEVVAVDSSINLDKIEDWAKSQLYTVTKTPDLNGEFPVDNLDHALHSDHIADNYIQRSNALLSWLNGSNCVRAVTEILRAYNSAWPEKWMEYVHPDALVAETDEGIRLFLVKRALHLVFIAYENEDITNVLMAVNNNDTTPTWFVTFERQVVPVMIRLGL